MCYWWNKVIKYVDNLSIYTQLLIGIIFYSSMILSSILSAVINSNYIDDYNNILKIINYILLVIMISASIVPLIWSLHNIEKRRCEMREMCEIDTNEKIHIE